LEEWNLRDLIKSHIISLLQNQRVYWKQRGKIKWVKLGNKNTRFFHSKATINYKHNYINMLSTDDSEEITDHEGKASILWKAFKDRMGKCEKPKMLFNPDEIYGQSNNEDILHSLEILSLSKKLRK
jgi:hypothetical protein